jgi:hypothetical protein
VRSRDADEILGVKVRPSVYKTCLTHTRAFQEELEAVKHAYFELQEEKREVDNRLEIMERHAEIVMVRFTAAAFSPRLADHHIQGAERRVLCIIDGDGL